MEEKTEEVVEQTVAPTQKTDKEIVTERLNLVFGEDCVDVMDKGGVIIHFPDIDITNGEDIQNIRDLFVKLNWSYDEEDNINSFSNSIWGTRSSYTAEEVYSQYSHSHLPTLFLGRDEDEDDEEEEYDEPLVRLTFSSFCLGDDDLAKTLAGLSLGFTVDNFYVLLNLIDDFVRWEIVSGGPYIQIKNISRADNKYREVNRNTSVSYDRDFIIEQFYTKVPDLEQIEAFDYYVDNTDLYLLSRTEAAKKVSEILLTAKKDTTFLFRSLPTVKLYKDKYYDKTTGIGDLKEYGDSIAFDHYFHFKKEVVTGRILPLSIERDKLSVEIEQNGETVVHPSVVDTVLTELERKLYNTLHKKETWKLIK